MEITNFYQSLFIISGLILVIMFILECTERVKAEFTKKVIYNRLHNIWKLFSEVNNEDGREHNREAEILRKECESIYIEYIKHNKYLSQVFSSPENLLRAFIVTLDKQELDNIKYEIICHTNNSEIIKKTTEKENSKMATFEKISFFTNIIGIIVTIISFFM